MQRPFSALDLTEAPFAFPLRRASLALVAYLLIPMCLAWFLVVAVSASKDLTQDSIRVPTPAGYDPYFDDFVVFYSAGRMAREGSTGQVYQLDVIHAAAAANLGAEPSGILALPFFNPPHVLLVLAPLSLLSLGSAAFVWTCVGAAVFAGTSLLLLRGRRPSLSSAGAIIGILAVTSSMPFYQTLLHGQASFFLAAGLGLLWLGSFDRERPVLSVVGLLLLAAKPPLLVLPAAYLLVTRQWRTVAIFLALVSVGCVSTVLVSGASLLTDYAKLLAHASTWDDRNGISTWGMFGWNAFSKGILGDQPQGAIAALAFVLDAVTLGGLAYSLRGIGELRREERFACVVFGSLLLSPHVYGHDVLIAAVPLLLLVTNPVRRPWWIGFSAIGWFILYFHFDILSTTSINASSLWLAGGILLASSPLRRAGIGVLRTGGETIAMRTWRGTELESQ